MSAHVVIATTDAFGLAMLRRHPRFHVTFAAPSGTERPTVEPQREKRDGAVVQPVAVTVKEAAGMVGLSERQFRKLVAQGEVTVLRVGRSVRARVIDVEAWAERQLDNQKGGRGVVEPALSGRDRWVSHGRARSAR